VTHSGIETAVLIGMTAIAAVLGFVYHAALVGEVRRRRKEASRFPMFAVRDRLVELVADGKIAADDPAWRSTYATANGLLSLHQKLHVQEVFKQYLAYSIVVAAVPSFRAQALKTRGEIIRAQRRCPPFGRALREMEQAFRQMVEMRTGAWHTAGLRLFLWRLTLPAPFKPRLVIVGPAAPSPSAVQARAKVTRDRVRNARRSLNRGPQSGDLAAFASYAVAC
jgi:hypothetical protein